MRSILIDWIVEVHLKFKMVPETLFLSVSLIDRYLEKENITKGRLQLVGIVCLMIAGKYEEIYPPEVKDYRYITDNAYTKQEILDMESRILSVLDFAVNVPTANRFLERYSKIL